MNFRGKAAVVQWTPRGIAPGLWLAPLVLVALSGSARAQSSLPAEAPPATLDWNATPPCSDGTHVLDAISRILSGGSGARREVVARTTLEKGSAEAWRVVLDIEVAGVVRRRAFDAESCQAAVDAAALILAIAIDPQVAGTAAPIDAVAPPPAPPATVAPTQAVVATPPEVEVAPKTATLAEGPTARQTFLPLSLVVAASLTTDAGTVPAPTLGAELAFGLQAGRFRLEAAGADWASKSVESAASAAGADFHLVSGELRGEYTWPLGRFSLGPVVEGGFEWIRASGFGGTKADSSPTAVLGVVGGGGILTFRLLAPLALRLLLEGEVPLTRPSFIVENPAPSANSQVFRSSEVAGRALFGVEVVIR